MFSEYIKTPQLRSILDKQQNCEQTLQEIKDLIDGKSVGNLTLVPPASASGPLLNTPNVSPEYDSVVKEFSTLEKKLALQILGILDRWPEFSWDKNSYEISLSGEVIKFTDIRILLKATVSKGVQTLPVGFALFLHALLDAKVPHNMIKSGNAISLKNSLLQISFKKNGNLSNESEQNVESNELAEQTTAGNDPVATDGPSDTKKREREDDDDQETTQPKRFRESEPEENPPAKNFDIPVDTLKGLRRSPRLKNEVQSAWKSQRQKKK